MKKKRVLFICQEITPYLPETYMSKIGRNLPQGIQEKGKEIRTFMPRFGCINERRNQLHEVIRLSGMNLIINDNDHPLIIKVASIQSARMQIYFIDNEDYFSRKNILTDDNGDHFDDNDERAIFFARGVIETVNKLNWQPDVVHCHGWFTGITSAYMKYVFNDNPLFSNAKTVFSIYNNKFEKPLDANFIQKIKDENINADDLELLKDPTYINVHKFIINHSDAIIAGEDNIDPELIEYTKKIKKPFLPYTGEESFVDACSDFYDSLLN